MSQQAHAESLRPYYIVFGALMALVALTVEVARHDFGEWNFGIAVLIAAIKAALIIYYFMQVRRSTPLTRLMVCAGFLWLGIMFVLSFADYWNRG